MNGLAEPTAAASPANAVLSTLNLAVAAQLYGGLRRREFSRGEGIFAPGQVIDRAVFPTSATLAAITVMRDGREVETSLVGPDGAFGLACAFGPSVSSQQVIARFPGEAYEITAEALSCAVAANAELGAKLVQSLQAALTASAAASACGLLHDSAHRLCRGLLEVQDRLGVELLPLTQEELATILGVQRTTVTKLARHLKVRRVIDYRRGKIRILDRPALQLAACECYAAPWDQDARVRTGRP